MSALIHAVGAAGWTAFGSMLRDRLTVLTYHGISAEFDPLGPREQITARLFEAQMSVISAHFNVLPLGEAVERLQQGSLPARALAITFDDGYLNNVEIALPILQAHKLTATFFICSGYLEGGLMFNDLITEAIRGTMQRQLNLPDGTPLQGPLMLDTLEAKAQACSALIQMAKYLPSDERDAFCDNLWAQLAQGSSPPRARPRLTMSPEHVRFLHDQGMTIGGHSHTHPILTRCTPDQARTEVQRNRDVLTDILGTRPRVFAYPNGRAGRDFDLSHASIVRDAGYLCSMTTETGVCMSGMDTMQLPRFTPWAMDTRKLLFHLGRNAWKGTNPKILHA